MAMKKGKTAFQRRFATQGEIVVDYFARLGRRGGQAKARNHGGPAWQEVRNTCVVAPTGLEPVFRP